MNSDKELNENISQREGFVLKLHKERQLPVSSEYNSRKQEYCETFGAQLDIYLDNHPEINRRELAHNACIDYTYLSSLRNGGTIKKTTTGENKRYKPSGETVIRVIKALGFSTIEDFNQQIEMIQRWSLNFGQALKVHLNARLDMTQQEFAERAGMTPRGVQKCLSGETRTPRYDTAQNILDTLGFSTMNEFRCRAEELALERNIRLPEQKHIAKPFGQRAR